jgi:hypothetical protein
VKPRDSGSETDANDESHGTRELRGDNHQTPTDRKAPRFAETLRRQFRELVQALTHRSPGPPPVQRRRRTEDTGRAAFRMAAAKIMRREARVPAAAYAAIAFLSETLDWLNPWHHPVGTNEVHEDVQNTDQHDHLSLHL